MSKSLYVIGDIHGEYDKLKELYNKIIVHRDAYNKIGASLCFVGDYIDRGPDSNSVLGFVRSLVDSNPKDLGWDQRVVALMGNHELMAFTDKESWILNGGIQTYKSYGDDYWAFFKHPDYQWIKKLPKYYVQGKVAVAHAGIDDSELRAEDHSIDDLLWSRKLRMHEHDIYKYTVHGHTPMKEPIVASCVAYIDTGAVFGGKLTCLYIPDTDNPDSEDMRLIQSSGGKL